MKILLLGLLLALPARADIVFFDLNFSPMEITAVTAAAKARGEKAHIFPERTPEQQRDLDKYYRLAQSLQTKLRGCQGADCGEIIRRLAEVQERLQAITAVMRKVENGELENIFASLDARSVKVSTMIFSGHSGGTGQVGGLLGGIVVGQVRQAFDKYPRLLEPVRAILLWGCYSGTLHSLSGIWQKNFPSVSTWGGFENRSPLGIRESSGRFLKSFLLSESKLRAAKGLNDAHRVFRSLDLVAELDGTAVVRDMYFTYDQAALVSEMLQRCQAFDNGMMDQFLCYDEGRAGCENPPADHRGALRDIYNYLQKNRHCHGSLKEKYPQLPSLEYLIRLIYLDNVKKNFVAQHAAESSSFGRIMKEVGPVPPLADFGKSTRKQDMEAFGAMATGLNALGFRDLSIVDRPNWKPAMLASMAKEALTNLLGPSFYRTFESSCVPFSWVDPGSREKDSCQFSQSVEDPLPVTMESQLVAMLAHTHIDKYLADHMLRGFWIDIPRDKEVWKEMNKAQLRLQIKDLEQLSDRSALEEARLALAREKLIHLDGIGPRELAAEEAAGLRGLVVLTGEKIEWAGAQPHGEVAKIALEERRRIMERRIADLEQIAQGLQP